MSSLPPLRTDFRNDAQWTGRLATHPSHYHLQLQLAEVGRFGWIGTVRSSSVPGPDLFISHW